MDSIKEIIIQITSKIEIVDNDRNFLERVFLHGVEVYKKRLERIGFINSEMVLDAGCGFGQWSLALSELGNKKIYSIDIDSKRSYFLEVFDISKQNKPKHLNYPFIWEC